MKLNFLKLPSDERRLYSERGSMVGIRSFYLSREHRHQIDKVSDSLHTESRFASSVICGLGALWPLWQTRSRICISDSFMDRFFRPRSLFGSERSAFLADL